MKKCVKCNRKYDDSVLVCQDCGLYLIADVVSDLGDDYSSSNLSSTNQTTTNRRRNRVVPIVEPVVPSDIFSRSNSSQRFSSFEPSDETADVRSNNNSDTHRTTHRQSNFGRNFRRFIRRYYPIIRIIIPIILLVIAIIWISVNWVTVSEFLQCCLISGIVGGALLTFLSVRFGHHFNIDVATGGVIGGMIIGCILKYNIFGTATGLLELLNGIGPCIIVIIGIYIAIRGVFRG